MYCYYCGSNSHTQKNCPHTWHGSENRNNMRCEYCGSREHNIKACPSTASGSMARTYYPGNVSDDFVKD